MDLHLRQVVFSRQNIWAKHRKELTCFSYEFGTVQMCHRRRCAPLQKYNRIKKAAPLLVCTLA
jgi:hypothetical protein